MMELLTSAGQGTLQRANKTAALAAPEPQQKSQPVSITGQLPLPFPNTLSAFVNSFPVWETCKCGQHVLCLAHPTGEQASGVPCSAFSQRRPDLLACGKLHPIQGGTECNDALIMLS